MFVIGVTGGIGSGKTAATNCFQTLGIDVVDADLASRVVVERGTDALKQIAGHFGPQILLADGALDRAALRRIIFEQPDAKQWLERLLHPLIGQEIQRQLQNAASPYVILVSPLLVEAGQNRYCHRILVIDVPEDVQLQRTVTRDSNDPDQVRRIIASQASRKQRLEQADDVLENNGSFEQLRAGVERLHDRYLQLAQAHAAAEK
jgi:dephospho-CoA kinase